MTIHCEPIPFVIEGLNGNQSFHLSSARIHPLLRVDLNQRGANPHGTQQITFEESQA
jgi:hypothetical protein